MSSNGTGNTNFIADMIRLAEEANAQAETQRKAMVNEVIKGLEKAAQPYLEKLKASGVEIGEGTAHLQNEGKAVSSVEYPLRLAGFLPFYLVVQPHGPDSFQAYFQNNKIGGGSSPYQNEMVQVKDEVGFGRFLLKRKSQWEKAEAERLEKQRKERQSKAGNLSSRLDNPHWNEFPATVEAAETLIAEIVELDPAREAQALRVKWQSSFEVYQRLQVQQQERKEAEYQQAQLYQAKLDEFKTAWAAFVAERERIRAINRERYPALQESYNQPFKYYELHYALYVAPDPEEGYDEYVDKDKVDCLANSEGGYHLEIQRNGLVRRFHYKSSHVFKVSDEIEILPTDYAYAGRYNIQNLTGDIPHLFYTPGIHPGMVEAEVKRVFEPVPPEPAPDRMLSYNDVQRVMRGDENWEEPLF
ncbi:MAG: hypothetical protein KJ077_50415 [Anaerolineae bacterium]|nr:hypothetical protein [Anaerolineae bacterium]